MFIYRGLLEKLPHENALAMMMAHEIAHVLHRDPAVKTYGSNVGAADLFHVFAKLRAGTGDPPKVLTTHPVTSDRIARIETLARERGWVITGATTSLAEVYRPSSAMK